MAILNAKATGWKPVLPVRLAQTALRLHQLHGEMRGFSSRDTAEIPNFTPNQSQTSAAKDVSIDSQPARLAGDAHCE
jgi:hypothetical protein